jgi:hypothetical protein
VHGLTSGPSPLSVPSVQVQIPRYHGSHLRFMPRRQNQITKIRSPTNKCRAPSSSPLANMIYSPFTSRRSPSSGVKSSDRFSKPFRLRTNRPYGDGEVGVVVLSNSISRLRGIQIDGFVLTAGRGTLILRYHAFSTFGMEKGTKISEDGRMAK